MSKSLFEDITDDEAKALEWVLKNKGSTAADYFFTDPTIDGKIQELKKYGLIKDDVTGLLTITELGRSALKEHKQISEQRSLVEKQRMDEIASLKAIAESSKSQAETAKAESESAKKDALFAKTTSIIAIVISIAAIIVPLLFQL